MSDPLVFEKLVAIIRAILGDDETPMSRSTTADDTPQWDSINHISIVAAAEASFGVKFRTAEIERLKNIGDFVELIQQKLK
jgi:acyl carrier protein